MRPSRTHHVRRALAAFGLPILLLGVACGGPASQSGPEGPGATSDGQLVSDAGSLRRAELIQADRDFADRVRRDGIDAWVAAFEEDGVVLPADGPIAIGPEAIRDLFSPLFAEPSFDMSWVPVGSEVAGSGDFGYTFGDWKTSTGTAGVDLDQTEGKYVTVWRRGADGRWRVLADIGNTQPKSAAGE